MMKRAICYLAEHKLFNWVLVLAYVSFIVLAHEWFVNLSVNVMNNLSLPLYERVVATIAGVGLVGLLAATYRLYKSNIEFDKRGLFFFFATLIGLLIHFFVYTEMNIEFVHAMEFGLLSVFIYPLVGRYGAAVAYAFPVMLFDEWYQYQVLFDYVEYFEFNDIVLDLLGAGLFISILKVLKVEATQQFVPVLRRTELHLLIGLSIISVALLLTSQVVPYAAQATENTWLILNAIKEEYGFWRVHPLIGSTYHIIQPVPGLITVFVISCVYLAMDSLRPVK